jgi:hypothetical protein
LLVCLAVPAIDSHKRTHRYDPVNFVEARFSPISRLPAI